MKELDAEYDVVYIIDCLSESERLQYQDSKKLMESLAAKGMKQQTAYCGNRVSVLHVLNSFKDKAKSGEKFPLVFISHGDHGFLSIKHTSEQIDWPELRPILLEINQSMNGDLIVMMACCHGFKGYKIDLRDSKSEAFFGIVGPDRTISPDESIEANKIFFDCLLANKEVPEAVMEINKALGDQCYRALASQDNKLA